MYPLIISLMHKRFTEINSQLKVLNECLHIIIVLLYSSDTHSMSEWQQGIDLTDRRSQNVTVCNVWKVQFITVYSTLGFL